MKKLILLIMILIGCLSVSAQRVTLTPFVDGQTYMYSPTDYAVTNTVVRMFTLVTPEAYPATQDLTIKLDSVSGTHTNVAVSIYGVKSLIKNDSTIIGSAVNWVGILGGHLSADTTITISNASANRYRAYKIKVLGTGIGASKVSDFELKIRHE